MARDPLSWTPEDEKRRADARRRAYSGADAFVSDDIARTREDYRRGGLTRALGGGVERLRDTVQVVGADGAQRVNAVLGGEDYARQARAATDERYYRPVPRPAPPTAPARPSFENVESSSAPTQTDLSDPRLGLTRITRLPDGSFTDTADPGVGQDRYYDRTGRRVDTAGYGNSHGLGDASVSGPDAVRAYNRSVNASAMDMTDPANQRLVAERGTRGLARSAAMQQEAADRAAYTAELQMTSEQRLTREVAAMEQLGLDRRAQAQIGSQQAIAGARLAQQQAEQEQQAALALEEMGRYERELYRDNPQAFAMEQLALLEQFTPEERTRRLTAKTPQAALLRTAVRRAAADRLGSDFTPGQSGRTGGLLRTFGVGSIDANNNPWFMPDNRVDPGDIIPGLSLEDWDVMEGADQTLYGRR